MSTLVNQKTQFVIEGEPASKSNARKLVHVKGRMLFIKSKKALQYVKDFDIQCPSLETLYNQDVMVEMIIFYKTRRPDLDESLILDCMQGKIYENDRQVKQKHIYWSLDRERPRTHIRVTPLETCGLPSDF
jgi:Holliday junction resolvase RusA-like endonuclease